MSNANKNYITYKKKSFYGGKCDPDFKFNDQCFKLYGKNPDCILYNDETANCYKNLDDCNNKQNNCKENTANMIGNKFEIVKDPMDYVNSLLVRTINDDIDKLVNIISNTKGKIDKTQYSNDFIKILGNVIKIDITEKTFKHIKILFEKVDYDENIIKSHLDNINSPQLGFNFDTMVKILNMFLFDDVYISYHVFIYKQDKISIASLLKYYEQFNVFKGEESHFSPIFLPIKINYAHRGTNYDKEELFSNILKTKNVDRLITLEMVLFLLDNGINPNLIINGRTHLIILMQYNYAKRIYNEKGNIIQSPELLVKRMDTKYINYMDDYFGATALMYSVTINDLKLTKMLLDYGANKSINFVDKQGDTVLLCAIKELRKMLSIISWQYDIDTDGKRHNVYFDEKRYILNVNRMIDNIKLLFEYGSSETINQKNIAGDTALILYSWHTTEIAKKKLYTHPNEYVNKIIEMLLQNGADPNIKNPKGLTAIDFYPHIKNMLQNGSCNIQ